MHRVRRRPGAGRSRWLAGVRFKLDENLPDELRQLLQGAGWDSLTVVEQQLGGAQDPQLAQVCREEERIFVTFDRGSRIFVRIRPLKAQA